MTKLRGNASRQIADALPGEKGRSIDNADD
jgi:hypothetical protein